MQVCLFVVFCEVGGSKYAKVTGSHINFVVSLFSYCILI